MRWMLDLNVLLDVVQHREPFFENSQRVVEKVVLRQVEGCIPGHALTTLFYILQRFSGAKAAREFIDWALTYLEITPQDREVFVRARALALDDFEDAVVAASAEASGCDLIVTRNVVDFKRSPVSARTPEEALGSLAEP